LRRGRGSHRRTTLSGTKANQLAGELVGGCGSREGAIRNRILAVPNRLCDLTAKHSVALRRELREALTEAADQCSGARLL